METLHKAQALFPGNCQVSIANLPWDACTVCVKLLLHILICTCEILNLTAHLLASWPQSKVYNVPTKTLHVNIFTLLGWHVCGVSKECKPSPTNVIMQYWVVKQWIKSKAGLSSSQEMQEPCSILCMSCKNTGGFVVHTKQIYQEAILAVYNLVNCTMNILSSW